MTWPRWRRSPCAATWRAAPRPRPAGLSATCPDRGRAVGHRGRRDLVFPRPGRRTPKTRLVKAYIARSCRRRRRVKLASAFVRVAGLVAPPRPPASQLAVRVLWGNLLPAAASVDEVDDGRSGLRGLPEPRSVAGGQHLQAGVGDQVGDRLGDRDPAERVPFAPAISVGMPPGPARRSQARATPKPERDSRAKGRDQQADLRLGRGR